MKIDISRLSEGTHQLTHHVGPAFFKAYEERIIESAEVDLQLELSKSRRLVDIRLAFSGTALVACDRCLQPYSQPIAGQVRLVYSYDSSLKEMDDAEDIVYIEQETQELDISQDIYDYLTLALPQRRVPEGCPGAMCPPEVLAILEGETDEEEEEGAIDPRWADLQKLKEKQQPDN